MKDKILKIYELSIRGIGGERELAATRLRELLKKYNLTIEELLDEDRKRYWFLYKNKHEKKILHQIVSMVLDSCDFPVYRLNKRRNTNAFDLTPSEAAQVNLLMNTYTKSFRKEIDRCLMAFIQVNEIFMKKVPEEPPKLTAKQIEELKKILGLAEGMEKTPIPRKQIQATVM